jgi:hypothetical protein
MARPKALLGAKADQAERLHDAGVTQVVAARALEVSPRTVQRFAAD